MSEKDIIEKYFSRHTRTGNVDISVGDDAAVVTSPSNSRIVITTDTLNEGIHFFPDCNAEHLGHKSLAVSLSDLAAMGSTPLWVTLNLSLPEINHSWLNKFSTALYTLADRYAVKIVGGDLTRGPLSVTTQAIAYVPLNTVLTRSNAKAGDLVYVSGTLGDAMLATYLHQSKINIELEETERYLLDQQLHQPEPRVELGMNLLHLANACIDISDGLLIDLQRITSASQVGAKITIDKIPYSNITSNYIHTIKEWWIPMTHGDDYELLFTVAKDKHKQVAQLSHKLDCKLTKIGEIKAEPGITLLDNDVKVSLPDKLGFDHFGE